MYIFILYIYIKLRIKTNRTNSNGVSSEIKYIFPHCLFFTKKINAPQPHNCNLPSLNIRDDGVTTSKNITMSQATTLNTTIYRLKYNQ